MSFNPVKIDPNELSIEDQTFSSLEYLQTSDSSTKKGWRNYIGICLALFASLSFSQVMIFIKILEQYDASTVGTWQFAATFFATLPLFLYYSYGNKGRKIFEPIWPLKGSVKFKIAFLLLIRGISGCTAQLLQNCSLEYIMLADSTTIVLSTPIFVNLAGKLFLGEKCGVIPTISALLTFVGVMIIVRPPLLTGAEEFDMNTLIGTGIAFCSMIGCAIVFVVLRYLRELHFSLVLFAFAITGIIECSVINLVNFKFEFPQTTLHLVYGLGAGLMTFVGQILLTAALKYEEAGPIALARTCDVIFTFVLQFIFLGIYPDVFSLVGSSIVVGAVVMVMIQKSLSSLPEGHKTREKFSIFLI